MLEGVHEEKVHFVTDDLELEGLFSFGTSSGAVVIAHPHPQMGGDMHNMVVGVLTKYFREKGFSTLRFNFRGVGHSQGEFGNGIGEVEDLKGAISFVQSKGVSDVHLAGYSFGSWVGALFLASNLSVDISSFTMVSPPVEEFDFPQKALESLKVVVAGSEDKFLSEEKLLSLMPIWNPKAKLQLLPGATHFWVDSSKELCNALSPLA